GGRAAGFPALRDRPRGSCVVAVVDAAGARIHAERVQRVADLRGARLGARPRLPARLAELLALRGGARPRPAAQPGPGAGAEGAARDPGALPARQPACVQPEVLPGLGAALPRLRAEDRPAARRHRRPRRRGLPPLPDRPTMTTLGLLLALGSALALNWGFFV